MTCQNLSNDKCVGLPNVLRLGEVAEPKAKLKN